MKKFNFVFADISWSRTVFFDFLQAEVNTVQKFAGWKSVSKGCLQSLHCIQIKDLPINYKMVRPIKHY